MLKVIIADTPHKLEQGLMFVQDLPQDEGMLFIFPRPMNLTFWGKNTFIPLDIAFVKKDSSIAKISHIKPFDGQPVRSDVDCVFAIEANEGYFEKQKITLGSKINIERYKDAYGQGLVRFETNVEGNPQESEKSKTKQAQVLDQQQDVVPKIGKPSSKPVGDPIGQPPAQQEDVQDLPIISPGDIGKYLEDSFDEEEPQGPIPTSTGLPTEVQPEAEPVPEEIQEEAPQEPVPEKEYPQFTTAYAAIDWATNNNEVVRISYTSRKGRQITRDIEPHGQFHSESTHRQILVTFDETVGNIRAFIIHNITKWAFVGKQFTKKFVVRA